MNNASDVNKMFRIFYRNVSSCVFQHVPFKQTTSRELRLKSKPWINPYIQKMIKYRDSCSGNPTVLTLKKQRLYIRSFVIEWQTTSGRVKSNIFMSFFTQNKGNMKKLWSGIKSIVNLKNKSFNNKSQLISENGDIIKD